MLNLTFSVIMFIVMFFIVFIKLNYIIIHQSKCRYMGIKTFWISITGSVTWHGKYVQ